MYKKVFSDVDSSYSKSVCFFNALKSFDDQYFLYKLIESIEPSVPWLKCKGGHIYTVHVTRAMAKELCIWVI